MKNTLIFCCNYYRDSQYNDIIPELNIYFTHQNTQQLKDFLKQHEKQRINIIFEKIDLLTNEFVKDLKDIIKNYNVYIKLDWSLFQEPDGVIRNRLRNQGIYFYYNDIVDNWDMLYKFLHQTHVKEIYVGNNLGFELESVAAAAHESGVQVRVYPNLAQPSWEGVKNPFFIRPEDCFYYPEVDTFELFSLPIMKNMDELYKIYKFDKIWYGNLQALIIGLEEPIDGRLLDEHWVHMRQECGKRCLKNNICHVCERFIELSRNMSEKEKSLNQILKK